MNSADWEKLFSEQRESGLIVSHFCQARGISAGSFRSAMKRKKILFSKAETPLNSSCGPTSLPNAPKSSRLHHTDLSSPFVALTVGRQTEIIPDIVHTAIRVQLRSGHQLHVDAGFDADHLRRLIHALEAQS